MSSPVARAQYEWPWALMQEPVQQSESSLHEFCRITEGRGGAVEGGREGARSGRSKGNSEYIPYLIQGRYLMLVQAKAVLTVDV